MITCMAKYSLSNTQMRELVGRGQPLLLALPLDRECDSEETARHLAAEWLMLPQGFRVVAVRVAEVAVSVPTEPYPDAPSLIQRYGPIIRRDADPLLTRRIETCRVIVAEVQKGRKPKSISPLKTPQWPGGRLE